MDDCKESIPGECLECLKCLKYLEYLEYLECLKYLEYLEYLPVRAAQALASAGGEYLECCRFSFAKFQNELKEKPAF